MAHRPLKVVNIIEEARIGGPQLRIFAVGEKLREIGIETTVYTAARDHEAYVRKLEKSAWSYRMFPLVRLQTGLGNQVRYALDIVPQILRYVRALRHDRPDVVHANSAAQWRPVIAARILGIPCVWHLNDTNMPAPVRIAFHAIRRSPAAFIVSGRRVERYYLPRGSGGRPVQLIHAPVDATRFCREGRAAPDILALPGLKVVNVGNVNPDKDIETFVRVAVEVNRRAPRSVTFVQVGGLFSTQDAYTTRVRELIGFSGATIHFLGHRSDVADVLRASDVYLHTARNEASGMAVWEAISCGLPVVTTDVADYRELHATYPFGSVVSVGDVQGLADALFAFGANTAAREKAIAAGSALVREVLDLPRVVEAHARVYHLIAGRPSAAVRQG